MSFFDLPNFDPNGANALLWMQQLQVMLENMVVEKYNQITYFCFVEQASEPNQAQWEAQWLYDGHTLPIPNTAICVWWNTSSSTVGGVYGTTPLSSGNVIKRESENASGGVSYRQLVSLGTAVTALTSSIGVANSNHPSLTFDLPVLSDVLLMYKINVVIASGAGTYGADFLFDGLKVGTQYNSLPSNTGIINANATGLYEVYALIPNVVAGQHTVQVIFGVTGSPASPPALTYGGTGAGANQYGLRELYVEAIAK